MKWEFNEEVAARFDIEADKHIPKYRVILYETINRIITKYDRYATILDFGCATGNTLDLLKKQGFYNVEGIDNSIHMVDACVRKGHNVHLGSEVTKQFDVIIANWTLHFISPDRRYNAIENIYNNLKPGGMFILSERIETGTEDILKYYEWKRSNFVSDSDIIKKQKLLDGILITLPEDWYTNSLNQIGFNNIEVFDKTNCFITFMGIK